MSEQHLERFLAELDERNHDNVTRTESYLELYAWTRAHPPDLPWVLMAHLVSRNGGYMMSDVGATLDDARSGSPFTPASLEELFLFLERANYLIFHDAWFHVVHHLLARTAAMPAHRVPRYVREELWPAYESAKAGRGGEVDADTERHLVQGLVTNEQNYIERRVVHAPRFAVARALVGFFESVGAERPLVMPASDAKITVGGFARLERRILTGYRLFDEILADRGRREEAYAWAREHPHTGDRAVYGARSTPRIERVWPVSRVKSLWEGVHAPPEHDPLW